MSFVTRRLAAACLAVMTAVAPAAAQDLELTITAPAGAGGGWDSAARSLQEVMMKTGTAKSVQVMNVPGAGGTVGLAQFAQNAKGSPDQLLVGGITMVGAILTNKAPVNLTNVTPIARLTGDPLVVVVPKNSPHQTLADLTAAIQADVSRTIWAGGSAGGADHILAALITQAAGGDPSKVNYVAYSGGGEALAAMLGGQVTAGISGYGEWQGQIESGDLRALAISYPEPIEGIEAQPLKAQGVDVELVNWRGIFAGPDIADADKQALSAAIEQTVKSPEWQAVLTARGWTDYYAPADEFAAFVASENERVHATLQSIGLAE
ncbi:MULTISPECIES: tripartite tricarboxylate transporter substrate binding protein [unclassified Paracoccus (in: a-proteobacteria)]|uniref:Bug family tripartite tricarboxylate transporter substrate binding protein n=1 Tax=unclassified Paracoccus (in: a-proteobacteria) TaxID=2688777 RepID=UPI0015FFE880|nr:MULTISPECIES: tripartite tricarboxylate transporter substrate-binding protein [unclassified Paracoccus (in: a-proteobacteria)]MBB1492821.1 tripartite tricarboxylate transporter substrate binding protein [Paracoccus sp. MC1854]MBB1499254.1 tripartite tricarboxylate transporter substrate binding protein [Paracoccus sp. MC1862]QQO45845.1 tripartite tricarboxylate transporter substrate binding protein [Paracoccus sp. MC1862]